MPSPCSTSAGSLFCLPSSASTTNDKRLTHSIVEGWPSSDIHHLGAIPTRGDKAPRDGGLVKRTSARYGNAQVAVSIFFVSCGSSNQYVYGEGTGRDRSHQVSQFYLRRACRIPPALAYLLTLGWSLPLEFTSRLSQHGSSRSVVIPMWLSVEHQFYLPSAFTLLMFYRANTGRRCGR